MAIPGESVYRVPNNVESIQMEILTNGPVQAVIRIYEDLITYRSGAYLLNAKDLCVNHYVLCRLQVFIGIFTAKAWNIMPLKLSDGVKKTTFHIGWQLICGVSGGVLMDCSKY